MKCNETKHNSDSVAKSTSDSSSDEEEGSSSTKLHRKRGSSSRARVPAPKRRVTNAERSLVDPNAVRHINSEDDESQDDNLDDYSMYDEETATELRKKAEKAKTTELKGQWLCNQPVGQKRQNLNEHITVALERLQKKHETMLGPENHWRAFAYSKAVAAIKRHDKVITSGDEALAIPNVGKKIAAKIDELIEHGKIAKLENLETHEIYSVIGSFMEIWGVGKHVAHELYAKGYRSYADLLDPNHPSTLKYGQPLTKNQMIGLQFIDEFKQRIPRAEVAEIERIVRETVQSIRPGMIAVCTGSYRRGKETCGDIDILMSHEDGTSQQGVLLPLVKKLQAIGLLTHHLTMMKDETHNKYMGVCQVNGGLHRRIDFLVVPIQEWPCALLHFTGNDLLNRSMRLFAQKKGMHLSDKGLFTNIKRIKSDRVNDGVRVPNIRTERDVFEALGLPYREPHERD